MSTLRTNNVQVGQSPTATNNFTLYQPSVPDGTVRLGVGNTGATTLDAVTVTNAGSVGIGTSSPSNLLTVQTAATGTTAGSNVIARFQSNASGRDATIQLSDNVANSATISMLGGNLSFGQNGIQRMQLDTSGNCQFNSGYGSVATAYGCRAWVNFNGTGTVAIRASGNVSSITDNGTGDYTVNFTTAMPDANYVSFFSGGGSSNSFIISAFDFNAARTTAACRFVVVDVNGSVGDPSVASIAIVR
jgi:hypothetical protein